MKEYFLTSLLCLSGIMISFAQQQLIIADTQTFEEYTNKVDADRQAASDKKDFLRAETLLKQWVRGYDALPDSIKRNFKDLELSGYYNIACYNALLGKKKEALSAFEKCVSLGYSNYKNAVNDADLESLRKEKRYLSALQIIRERGDMGYVLRQSGAYNTKVNKKLPAFSYQNPNSPDLVAFKNKYMLDSVAGNKDEISRIKNLLLWTHNVVRHDGISDNPPSRNGNDIIEVCQKENRGVNCRMMATILMDAYQSLGWKARVVTCMPKDTLDSDCHVINVVWSKTLNKWIWVDPTFNAYVTDKAGNLLSIEEVRENLYNDRLADLVLNDGANWNNQSKQTREYYLGHYMSKKLYWLQCSVKNEWNAETDRPDKPATEYINLYPGGYNTAKSSKRMLRANIQYETNNPVIFWQKPAGEN